jgi:hypothetical protein
MQTISAIIAAIAIAYVWVNVAPFLNWIRAAQVRHRIWAKYDHYGFYWKPRRIKPFDCDTCLSFWLTPVLYFTIQNPIIYLFSASCVSVCLITVFIKICTYNQRTTND